MVSLGFLNPDNAPTNEAKAALPTDITSPSSDIIDKLYFCFMTRLQFKETMINPLCGGPKEMKVIWPKFKGIGIMISEFICEKSGYLALMDEEYKRAKQSDPTIKKHARQWLEYGEAKEGYWTSEKFMKQIKEVAKIVDFKFAGDSSRKIVLLFDHSSCHSVMPDDVLLVSKMNVNSGGKQPVMRDKWWGGKP